MKLFCLQGKAQVVIISQFWQPADIYAETIFSLWRRLFICYKLCRVLRACVCLCVVSVMSFLIKYKFNL